MHSILTCLQGRVYETTISGYLYGYAGSSPGLLSHPHGWLHRRYMMSKDIIDSISIAIFVCAIIPYQMDRWDLTAWSLLAAIYVKLWSVS